MKETSLPIMRLLRVILTLDRLSQALILMWREKKEMSFPSYNDFNSECLGEGGRLRTGSGSRRFCSLSSRSLDTMPQLLWLTINQRRIWEEDTESESEEEVMDGGAMELVPTFLNEKESSMLLPSKLEHLFLYKCDLLDEYLVLVPSLFLNLKQLHIEDCPSITVVPECIKECHFLRKLTLFGCQQLREICEGILPRLTDLSVWECRYLSSSCRSMLVRQELHEAVEINLVLQNLEGETIPEWFEHQNRGRSSLSFWFRNDFPRVLLCATTAPSNMSEHPSESSSVDWGHTLFCRLDKIDMQEQYMQDIDPQNPDSGFDFGIGWNHAEVWTDFDYGFGIHVLKEQNMQDIRFTNPNTRRKFYRLEIDERE